MVVGLILDEYGPEKNVPVRPCLRPWNPLYPVSGIENEIQLIFEEPNSRPEEATELKIRAKNYDYQSGNPELEFSRPRIMEEGF